MKQTLLMLCTAFVALTAAAQPVPEKASVDNDAFNWPIGHKAKVLTKDVWLPKTTETYDEQGHFLFKDECTRADNGQVLTDLFTNADGSMTRTTHTSDDNGWDNGYIYEKYYKGKWVVSSKRTYVNDKWGNTAEDVNLLYYDADNDSERVQRGSKTTYSRDTLENGDTKYRAESYNWNSNSESWDKSNYSTREEHFDYLGRCTDIVEEQHYGRDNNNGTLTTTRFSYKDDGDNKPYQCSTSYQFFGGARDSFTVTIDNIQWGK